MRYAGLCVEDSIADFLGGPSRNNFHVMGFGVSVVAVELQSLRKRRYFLMLDWNF